MKRGRSLRIITIRVRDDCGISESLMIARKIDDDGAYVMNVTLVLILLRASLLMRATLCRDTRRLFLLRLRGKKKCGKTLLSAVACCRSLRVSAKRIPRSSFFSLLKSILSRIRRAMICENAPQISRETRKFGAILEETCRKYTFNLIIAELCVNDTFPDKV